MNKKALKILLNAYWKPSTGWTENTASIEDFEYAKQHGFMFDPISLNHDQVLKDCISVCAQIEKEKTVTSFLSSLSSRRLDLRSGIASYACGQSLPDHEFKQSDSNTLSTICMYCTEPLVQESVDLSILNFERFKFGGVRHLQPSYIWFDLSLLAKEPEHKPTTEDIAVFKKIIEALRNIDGDRISDAENALKGAIKSNKNERVGIISTLGYCGILHIPGYESFHNSYIPYHERSYSSYAKSDWPFPADLWRPSYGLNDSSIEYWFGKHLS